MMGENMCVFLHFGGSAHLLLGLRDGGVQGGVNHLVDEPNTHHLPGVSL